MQDRLIWFIRFFLTFFLIYAVSLPAYAQAEMMTPELTSRVHCTLFVNSLRKEPFTPAALRDAIESYFGKANAATDRLMLYLERTEWLADFGFLVGARWETIALSDRNRFNRSFSKHIRDFYQLEPYSSSDCAMNVTIHGAPEPDDPQAATISMQAIAYTQLISKNSRMLMIYSYDYLPESGWNLNDISLQDRSLVQTYRTKVNAQIQNNGLFHVEDWMQKLDN